MLVLSSADLSELFFSKKDFENTIRVSNDSDLDKDRHSVGHDLGPNCFHFFSHCQHQISLLILLSKKGNNS